MSVWAALCFSRLGGLTRLPVPALAELKLIATATSGACGSLQQVQVCRPGCFCRPRLLSALPSPMRRDNAGWYQAGRYASRGMGDFVGASDG